MWEKKISIVSAEDPEFPTPHLQGGGLMQSPGQLTPTLLHKAIRDPDPTVNSLCHGMGASPLCTWDVRQSIIQDHIVPHRNSLSSTRLLSGTSSGQVGSPLAAAQPKELMASLFEQ